MNNYTSITTITFTDNKKTFIRVFYQHDFLIKESCYSNQDGWYTMRDDVAAENARKGSPVAATGNGLETRVFFVDQGGILRQRVRTTKTIGDPGTWEDDPNLPEITPAPSGRLTTTLSDDEEDANVHVIYQDAENLIKEIKFDASSKAWSDSIETVATDAKPGTSLSVVATAGELRLFYQNTQDLVRERYSSVSENWREGKIPTYKMVSLAPLGAVAWKEGSKFEIHLFSVGNGKNISERVFTKRRGWDGNVKASSETVFANAKNISAVAAVYTSIDKTISIFYQPQPNMIGMYSVTAGKRVPLGIPTSALSSMDTIKMCTPRVTKIHVKAAKDAKAKNAKYSVSHNLNLPLPTFKEKQELALPVASLWQIGATLRVQFLGGSQNVQGKVMDCARIWMEYANVNLEFVYDGDSEIRVAFDPGASWSRIGTDNHNVGAEEATMNLGWIDDDTPDEEISRVVLHEFGHALGCIHEHQSPAAGIQWDTEAVYAHYAQSDGWDRATVDVNIFEAFDVNTTQFTEFDPRSIMVYAISRQLTLDGFEVQSNDTLSDMDKDFIGRMYPF